MKLNYDNITISGTVAVGKDTLRNNLLTTLEPLGWKGRSLGAIVREFTNENILPNASLAPDDFHHKIDDKVVEILKNEKQWIIEAWMSGFLAKEIDTTLRILLICENKALKIDRVANRDKVTVENAKNYIKHREEDNLKTFQRLYGNYSFWDPKYYHLVIDTYANGQMECVEKALDVLGYKI
ncbi:MAG: cytidylate kinase family protein [Patescibacteria group bacterium]